MPEARIAVIGGTGLYDIEGLTDIEEVDVDTPFGKPSDSIHVGKLGGVGMALTASSGCVMLPFRTRTLSCYPATGACDANRRPQQHTH